MPAVVLKNWIDFLTSFSHLVALWNFVWRFLVLWWRGLKNALQKYGRPFTLRIVSVFFLWTLCTYILSTFTESEVRVFRELQIVIINSVCFVMFWIGSHAVLLLMQSDNVWESYLAWRSCLQASDGRTPMPSCLSKNAGIFVAVLLQSGYCPVSILFLSCSCPAPVLLLFCSCSFAFFLLACCCPVAFLFRYFCGPFLNVRKPSMSVYRYCTGLIYRVLCKPKQRGVLL